MILFTFYTGVKDKRNLSFSKSAVDLMFSTKFDNIVSYDIKDIAKIPKFHEKKSTKFT